MSTLSFDPARASLDPSLPDLSGGFPRWHADTRSRVLEELTDFLHRVRVKELSALGVDEVLTQYAVGGKCVRSTFMYLGWLCAERPDAAALRASASLELLHAFALLQDDVMDDAVLRRGADAAHVRLNDRQPGPAGAVPGFGTSAATLLGDMCLVWAEQMLRESGVGADALARLWPRYDAMRIELAVGQFADLANDVRERPTLDAVVSIARAKSGNYTVRRPLELGAALAGASASTLNALGHYGIGIGEAFQLRDDLLGIFGADSVTGKPQDSDLGQHKATSVVTAALEMTRASAHRELSDLVNLPHLDVTAIERCRRLIADSGAPGRIEEMITERVRDALAAIGDCEIGENPRAAMEHMALLCTARQL
ncbi:polyprenyl synthetase family protein [Nocardia jejuensis]|uniref:polyprenyl synthetase family protein n=1 Tax=Nocardia jejuensis TaxID=328049 RepID=UPI0008364FF6|nr:polyprenyl synthetase family protein [Nocardia jejuensis]